VVELRAAERARLDMLADELRDVFADVPEGDEQFVFTVSGGNQPRLWIDMTSFVVLGRDRRTYRFLKDTRLGRTVIVETADIDDMADTVTNYVAERIIERERSLEGDWLSRRILREEKRLPKPEGGEGEAPRRTAIDRQLFGWIAAALLGGMLIGVLGLLAYAWVAVGPV
jgi:hypothetical protein